MTQFSVTAKVELIKDFRNQKKLIVDQPFTPISLIGEISSNITFKQDSKVAVLFTIEWAIYLRELGVSDITVITVKEDCYIRKACELFGFDYILLQEVLNNMMKFDVVVGNPPYTDGTQGASEIYTEIITTCIDKLEPTEVGFINPENLINGGQKKKSLREHILKNFNVEYVNFLNQKSDWHGNISVDTISWIAKRTGSSTTQVVSRFSKSKYFVSLALDGLTELVNSESQDLHDWITSIQTSNKLKLKSASIKTAQLGDELKITKESANSCEIRQGNVTESDNDKWRVAFGYMRCNTCALVAPGISIPSKYRYKDFDSEQEAKNFRDYMLSEPIRYVMKMTYTSRTLDNPQLSYVPVVDLSSIMTVTDETVYELFNTSDAVKSSIRQLVNEEVPF